MRWSNRVQAVTWAAEKIDQQLHKYVLPKVAFCCSTVWEVLGSESGGFGARKQKWNSSEIEQIKKVNSNSWFFSFILIDLISMHESWSYV